MSVLEWWETVVVPQLQFIEDRRLPLRAAETAPHGPAFSEDQRVSSVAVCFLVVAAVLCRSFSMPVVVRQARMVQTLLNSVEVPQLQFLHGYGRPCDSAVRLSSSPEFVEILLRNSGWYAWWRRCGVVCCSFAAFFGLRPSGR